MTSSENQPSLKGLPHSGHFWERQGISNVFWIEYPHRGHRQNSGVLSAFIISFPLIKDSRKSVVKRMGPQGFEPWTFTV